jgi:Cu2+-exporting ATPase
VARRVGAALGIVDVRAGMTPQGKHDCVTALQAEGAVVAMVGDGVNDAPVLAQAQVSVAMGGGAQLARTQSDFVLLSENLDHLRHGLRRALKPCRLFGRTSGGHLPTILLPCRWPLPGM